MKYAYYNTSLGLLKIRHDEKIKKIELVDEIVGEDERSLLTDKVSNEIKEYLENKRDSFDVYDEFDLIGTDFQKSVWNELIKIPFGERRTYKQIAEAIDNPKAVRAVGSAIGKNPMFIIIPCHRVIGSDGKLGGFAYGLEVKSKLLDIENA